MADTALAHGMVREGFEMPIVNTPLEIKVAIELLTDSEIAELADWLDEYGHRRMPPKTFDQWLDQAQGKARPGVTTDEIMRLNRDES